MRTAEEMVAQFNMSSMADLEDLVMMALCEQRLAIAAEIRRVGGCSRDGSCQVCRAAVIAEHFGETP